jgi:hypothetical protein
LQHAGKGKKDKLKRGIVCRFFFATFFLRSRVKRSGAKRK